MLNEQTFDKLYSMKLIGMSEGFKEQLEKPSFQDLSFEERFESWSIVSGVGKRTNVLNISSKKPNLNFRPPSKTSTTEPREASKNP